MSGEVCTDFTDSSDALSSVSGIVKSLDAARPTLKKNEVEAGAKMVEYMGVIVSVFGRHLHANLG